LGFTRTQLNDLIIQNASDGGSGEDIVLPKMATAGFVDSESEQVI
jgi:hypothetical protein